MYTQRRQTQGISLKKNWRPISLLNVVYKTATSCIAERMKKVLPTLITEDQTGFMANRYIGNNTKLIYDLINYCNTNRLAGLLLCIDFEKAFDSPDWTFMLKVIKAFGFQKDIRRWISVFYNNIKSTVLVNGQPSPWFSIKRGCRQGDPIYPYLFILYAEILAIMIKENQDIKGIIIGQTEHKISQFADDTELFQNGKSKTFEENVWPLQQRSQLKIQWKKISCSVQMIILKVTMFLILLFCMQNMLSIVADMKKSNLGYVHLERSWRRKKYEIEAHNQKLKLTLPDFVSIWADYKPVIMLE